MTTREPQNDVEALGALLRSEHRHLEARFASLVDGFRADPRSAGMAEWKAFETALRAHLAIEEEVVLPAFSESQPLEADAIRGEHAVIRGDLDELGLGVELHLVPVEVVERFIARLRDHAAREDAMLYRFVDTGLGHGGRESLIKHLDSASVHGATHA